MYAHLLVNEPLILVAEINYTIGTGDSKQHVTSGNYVIYFKAAV